MADDAGITLLIAAALDVALTRGAKRHLWIRVVNAISGLLFIALIGGLIYITFKYS
jgi:putative Ca2+/H+ antiporter (TMEM165/GDT1 family)